jgi:hypothetical protein
VSETIDRLVGQQPGLKFLDSSSLDVACNNEHAGIKVSATLQDNRNRRATVSDQLGSRIFG